MNKIFLAGMLVALLLASTMVLAKPNAGSYIAIPSRMQAQEQAQVISAPVADVNKIITVYDKVKEKDSFNESSIVVPGQLIERDGIWQPMGTTRGETTMMKTCDSYFTRVYARRTIANAYWDRLKTRMALRSSTKLGAISSCSDSALIGKTMPALNETAVPATETAEVAAVAPAVEPAS